MQKISEIKKVKIFDGIEDELQNFHYEIFINQNRFSFDIEDFYSHPLKELKNILFTDDFEKIVSDGNYKMINKLIATYKSDDNLSVKYVKRGNHIFIFSFGEYQPTRYIAFLDSVWNI